MEDSTAINQLMQFIELNRDDEAQHDIDKNSNEISPLGAPFVILVNYQHQADKLRFIEELAAKSLTFDLQLKTYYPNKNPAHGIGKLIGLLVQDAENNRLSLVTSLATSENDELDFQFLSYINLHRDRIIYQNLHYLLFVQSDQMEDFIEGAPDLWSFRQLVLYIERDESQPNPDIELSTQLMWKNIAGDIQQSKRDTATIEQAKQKITDTQNLVEKINDDKDKALLLFDLAKWLLRHELYLQAFEVLEQIINWHSKEIIKLTEDTFTNILFLKAETHYRMAHYLLAIEYLEQGLKFTKETEYITAKFYEKLADCYLHLNNSKAALFNYEKALNLAQETQNKRTQISVLGRKAEIKRNSDLFNESIELAQQALNIAIDSHDNTAEAWIRIILGSSLSRIKQFDSALSQFNKAINQWEEIEFVQGIAICHASIGQIFRLQENLDKAISSFKLALTFAEKVNDKLTMANVYWNLARCFQETDNNQAITYAQKSLNIYTQLDNPHAVEVEKLLNELKHNSSNS